MKSLMKNYALKLFGVSISYLITIYLARLHSLSDLGLYYIILNTLTLSGIIGTIGLSTIMLRVISNAEVHERYRTAISILLQKAPFILVVSFITILCLTYLQKITPESTIEYILLYASGATFATTLIYLEYIRVVKGVSLYEFFRSISRPILTIFFLSIGTSVVFSLYIAIIINFSLMCLVMFRTSKEHKENKLQFTPQKIVSKELIYLTLINILGAGLSSTDILLFGILSNTEMTGIYGAASRYCFLLNFIMLATSTVIGPKVAQYEKGKISENTFNTQVIGIFKRVRLYAVGMAVCLILAFPLYAWLVDINHPYFYTFFYINISLQLISVIIGPNAVLMTLWGHAKILFTFNVIAIAFFTILAIFLYPLLGIFIIPLGLWSALISVKIMSFFYLKKYHLLTL